jgi:NAD(P)-dependent dehydrogenase (short-subunit alcohol dehydrogenase family)
MQTVLISGASSGIGRETAEYLAKRGLRVFAGARHPARAAVLVETGRCLALPLEVVPLDVDDPASVDEALARVVARAGRLDAIVNNAALPFFGPVEATTDDQVRRVFETNVLGALRLTRAALPYLRRSAGTVVQISSVQGRLVSPFGGLYAASKWALEAFSEALRAETKPFGVRVVVIEPGFVMTPFASKAEIPTLAPDSPYRPMLAALQPRLAGARERGVPPTKVAAAVHRALTDRRSPFRIAVGPDARLLLPLRRLLPDAIVFAAIDRFLASRIFRDPLPASPPPTSLAPRGEGA